jgi:hypothetical protein
VPSETVLNARARSGRIYVGGFPDRSNVQPFFTQSPSIVSTRSPCRIGSPLTSSVATRNGGGCRHPLTMFGRKARPRSIGERRQGESQPSTTVQRGYPSAPDGAVPECTGQPQTDKYAPSAPPGHRRRARRCQCCAVRSRTAENRFIR